MKSISKIKSTVKRILRSRWFVPGSTLGLALCCVVLTLLQLADIWGNAIIVFLPMVGMLMLVQAYDQQKKNKSAASACFWFGVLSFVAAAIVVLIQMFAPPVVE